MILATFGIWGGDFGSILGCLANFSVVKPDRLNCCFCWKGCSLLIT